jgi:hypothetical protein
MINVEIRDEIRTYQRYADRMEKHPNILTINEKYQHFMQSKKTSSRFIHLTNSIHIPYTYIICSSRFSLRENQDFLFF